NVLLWHPKVTELTIKMERQLLLCGDLLRPASVEQCPSCTQAQRSHSVSSEVRWWVTGLPAPRTRVHFSAVQNSSRCSQVAAGGSPPAMFDPLHQLVIGREVDELNGRAPSSAHDSAPDVAVH